MSSIEQRRVVSVCECDVWEGKVGLGLVSVMVNISTLSEKINSSLPGKFKLFYVISMASL